MLQETFEVGTRIIDTGRGVRIHKTVTQQPQTIAQELLHDTLDIERVACDAPVTEGPLPEVRYEGDTLVIPVFEEVLVVSKQLRVKEEIRVTRSRHSADATQTTILRSEQIEVERFDDQATGSAQERP